MSELSQQAETARQIYDKRAQTYDDSWHAEYAQFVVEYLDLPKGAHVLDLACGTGLLSILVAKAVGSNGAVVGVDIAEGMLEQAEMKKKSGRHDNVKFYCHDITKLESLDSIRGKTFDAIVCVSALKQLTSPLKAVRSWSQYLRPNALFFVDMDLPKNMVARAALEVASTRAGVTPPVSSLWVKDVRSLSHLLEFSGLKVEDLQMKEPFGVRTRSLAPENGEGQWTQFANSEHSRALRDAVGESRAMKMFLEDWNLFANDKDLMEEIEGVCVVKATKKSQELSPFPLQGSCACGYAKWQAAILPFASCKCCCKPCRKVSGSPFLTMMEFPSWAVSFTPELADMGRVDLSPFARRTFCLKCGSTWTYQAFRSLENVEIAMATLDEDRLQGVSPEDILKKAQNKWCWTSSKVGWFEIPDDGWPRDETMPSEGKNLVYETTSID